MRKIAIFIIVIATLICSMQATAQKIVNVDPGNGTLNTAISQNGSATYILKAGGWYGLSAIIQITTPVKIIGETPAPGTMPAIIQTGTLSSGATFSHMFDVLANCTFKNVFIVNADLNEGTGAYFIGQIASSTLIIDSVTADPMGTYFLVTQGQHVSDYITNSLFMRQGNMLSINDGLAFGKWGQFWDTLYVENNTFVDVGTGLYSPGNWAISREKVLWFNHNTFLFTKANGLGALYADQVFFTNNLCWLFDFHPMLAAWNAYGADPSHRTILPSIVSADTVYDTTASGTPVLEPFPSTRKYFIEYNTNYRTKALWDLLAYGNAQGKESFYMPFVWADQYKDSSRDAQMYSDHVNFPYFKRNNNIDDLGAENKAHDPQFVDPKIYALTDSAVAWVTSSAYQIWGLTTPPPASWAKYFYDNDGNLGNPTTWPRFNGAYKNQAFLTGSIEGLPLGDLNWFPDKKAIWQQHQAEITQHILSENESQMSITAVKQDNNQTPTSFSLSQNYPNPFNPSTEIKYSIPNSGFVTLKVYNMLGQEVASLVNQEQKSGNYTVNFNASQLASGVYMYKLQSGNFSLTKKMMLLK